MSNKAPSQKLLRSRVHVRAVKNNPHLPKDFFSASHDRLPKTSG